MKPQVIVILGSTATGKSDLAVRVAQKFNGEIISADSRQVYKNLDIGTGKITEKEMKSVPHHLIDVVGPKTVFTVTKYKKLAERRIKDILKRGKLPIIVGGTGFYIDAITKNMILPEVPPNPTLRRSMEEKSTSELFSILNELSPERAETIDSKNRVRLIRAIEIAEHLGNVPPLVSGFTNWDFIKIGLVLPKEELEIKVNKRVKNMFKLGLLKEIEKLKKLGVSADRLKEFGFEYNEPNIDGVIKATMSYAKRQDTWFKRDKEIKWYHPLERKETESYIKKNLV